MIHQMQCGPVRCGFADNGMVSEIILPEEFGSCNLLNGSSSLTLTLADGRVFTPVSGSGKPECWRGSYGAEILEFSSLTFADRDGKTEPQFKLSLRYEIFPDGTVFTDAFFLGEMPDKIQITGFELRIPLSLSAFETVRWSLAYRPKKADGALIQTSAPERELPPGTDRLVENCIFPLTGFNLWTADGPSCYTEFMMEGDNVLAGDPSCNRSSVTWQNGNPVLSWNFQTAPVLPASGPWQWRNRWGWVIAPAAQTRHYPPLPMYHYFDNTKRYPSDETLESMAENGAKVLILHENWRLDVQNGGQPYKPARLREVIRTAHDHGIRVMLYTRGNEESLTGEYGDWFEHLLHRNYDGLYVDYGGPFHYQMPPDEIFQGGRILFRKHYIENRRRRDIAGPDGLFYDHTGPMFSALGMTGGTVDGYVSGEGERGLLIRSRLDHAYFSMSAVCPGTMWTAAFPEYSGPEMIPYLAAAGQSPHVPLGVQIPSSSLAHPQVPGIGDVNFRPLWKLWNLMAGTHHLRVFSDYNCRGMFRRSPETGHYFMIAQDKALCIFANMSGQPISVDPALDLERAGIPAGWKRTLCLPTAAAPGKAVPFDGNPFELPPHGIGAILFGDADFAEYEKPYPAMKAAGREYCAEIERQKRFRAGSGPAAEWFIQVHVEDLPVPYEESMIVDLYDNRFELNEVVNGEYRKLGYLGKNGFQIQETDRRDFVMNGETSGWIALRSVLGSGKKHLAIRSLHRGDLYYVNTPFYSFLEVAVSRTPDQPEYTLRFMNELENDRSYLHFDLEFS